ncbi:MAG: hypothetical protein ABFC67_04775 [Mizugakiibacter sp.]|uniref:hypothetical protein n=1 Tax=Mizugakiibacter sp. TaxID=1972610 RepID=UPI00320EF803
MKVLSQLSWLVTFLASFFGAFLIFSALTSSLSAPQEAAGAALACGVVIVPYVFSRTIDALRSKE